MDTYEAPMLQRLGSVADFTRGEGWRGDADSFSFTIAGWTISGSFGQS